MEEKSEEPQRETFLWGNIKFICIHKMEMEERRGERTVLLDFQIYSLKRLSQQ